MLSITAHAEVKHSLLRRVAVFPIAEANVSTSEEAWWQMRENLTKDQRFFVASRRFMINRGVFQPRKVLKPADVIILAKILDAQALVVSYLQDRKFMMKVYDGENGYLLWETTTELHPAISVADQLIRVSTQMINSFVLAIPYQGFQVIDELVGKPVREQDQKKYADVFIGNNRKIEVGDSAQWVEVTSDLGKAFFSDSTRVTVIAEGQVVEVKGDRAVIEIEKMRDMDDLKENALVRFPSEVRRLKDLYVSEDRSSNLGAEYLSGEIKDAADFNKDHDKTSTALAWIVNMAGFILLAF
ncbi:MAG: hypothetical protein COT73_01150 [Bdellovibrio sp. CG10_big_fil_rev_8_21_14_0_10_47_8]|nr:MAG: hypothetical protein COT73_01150 [Bdellovibrio sp. CG10_big_fil_rev_8_21_14_0_10_47_8]